MVRLLKSVVTAILFMLNMYGNMIRTPYYVFYYNIHSNPGPEFISIFHLNIRSLRNKISYLANIASDSHIICVTETHLDEHVSQFYIAIEGFYTEPVRKDNSSHSGDLLVYVCENIFFF
jgi:hypothetical protein